jgi:hypothetical protein
MMHNIFECLSKLEKNEKIFVSRISSRWILWLNDLETISVNGSIDCLLSLKNINQWEDWWAKYLVTASPKYGHNNWT